MIPMLYALMTSEAIFWPSTSQVTISAVWIFAELERRGVPWWALPAGVVLPVEWVASFIPRRAQSQTGCQALVVLRRP